MTTKTVKVENYTAAMVATIKADYAAGVSVAEIAKKVGKGTRSIVAKLSREGVYKKAEYVAKDGNKAETKGALVTQIATALQCSQEAVASLEASTKQALKLVLAGLKVAAVPAVPSESDAE